MPPNPDTNNQTIAQANAAKCAEILEKRKKRYLRHNINTVNDINIAPINTSASPLIGALASPPISAATSPPVSAPISPFIGAAAGLPFESAPAPSVAVVSKNGITITYDDSSKQYISFTQNTLSLDSGLNVYSGITYLADGLDVDGDAHLYNNFTLDGSATLNNAVAITNSIIDGDTLTVNGSTQLNGELNVDSDLTVSGSTILHNAVSIHGETDINNILTINAVTNMNNAVTITQEAGNAITVDGNTELKGHVHMLENLTLDGTLNMSSGMNISRDTALGDALTIYGSSKFNNAVVIERSVVDGNALIVEGTIHGMENVILDKNLTVNGNLIVTGSQTIVESGNTVFVDNVVTYAKNNPADLVQAGLNIEYKPISSAIPMYAGLKRLPGTGEFVFFKNATAPIGNNDSFSPQVIIDTANQTVLDAQTAYNTAAAEVITANALVATRLEEKNTADAAKLPAFDPSTIPSNEFSYTDYIGGWITFDLGSSGASHNQFSMQESGWTQARTIQFLGSDNNSTWTNLGQYTNNIGYGTWIYTQTTLRYLRLVIINLIQLYDPNESTLVFYNVSVPNSNGVNLIAYETPKILSTDFSYGNWGTGSQIFKLSWGNSYERNSSQEVNNYKGNTITTILSSYLNTPTYLAYIAQAQPLIDAYNAAVTAYNTAVSDASLKASIATYYYNNIATVQAEANATIAQAQANAQLANASTGVYAVVMAESFNCASDARLKNNIVNLDGALDKLDNIRGVYHHWNNEAQPNRAIGVIAQEVQAVYPELVIEGGNGFLSVDYPKLTAVLLQSIKELKAMVLELAAKK